MSVAARIEACVRQHREPITCRAIATETDASIKYVRFVVQLRGLRVAKDLKGRKPGKLTDVLVKTVRAAEALAKQLGKPPTARELARKLRLKYRTLWERLERLECDHGYSGLIRPKEYKPGASKWRTLPASTGGIKTQTEVNQRQSPADVCASSAGQEGAR